MHGRKIHMALIKPYIAFLIACVYAILYNMKIDIEKE